MCHQASRFRNFQIWDRKNQTFVIFQTFWHFSRFFRNKKTLWQFISLFPWTSFDHFFWTNFDPFFQNISFNVKMCHQEFQILGQFYLSKWLLPDVFSQDSRSPRFSPFYSLSVTFNFKMTKIHVPNEYFTLSKFPSLKPPTAKKFPLNIFTAVEAKFFTNVRIVINISVRKKTSYSKIPLLDPDSSHIT